MAGRVVRPGRSSSSGSGASAAPALAPGSNFTKLQIGMSMKQITDLIGAPTDQGSYMRPAYR